MRENKFAVGDRVSFLTVYSDFTYLLNTDGTVVSETPTELGLFYDISFPKRPYRISVFNRMIKPYEDEDKKIVVTAICEDSGEKVFRDDNGRIYDFDNTPAGGFGGMGF